MRRHYRHSFFFIGVFKHIDSVVLFHWYRLQVVPEMEENQDTVETDNLLSSAAAFVEGGIQDACDDACSICLEEFSDSDPSTVISVLNKF